MNQLELQKVKNDIRSLNDEEFFKASDDFFANLEQEKESLSIFDKIKSTSLVEIFYNEAHRRMKNCEKQLIKTNLGIK